MMEVNGYMNKVQWDGYTLRAKGTTKAARVALLGPQHADGELVLTRDQIADVQYRRAGMMINGRVTLQDTGGRRYILHFRRKQRDGFDQLARELGVSTA